ncbi:MAG: hypothetical protein WDO69_24630 [Pseudomonadota bacterium]
MAGNAWGPRALAATVRRLNLQDLPQIGREALEPQRLMRGLRPMPLLLLLTWLLQRTDGVEAKTRAETDLTRAIVLALAERGLRAEAEDVHFITDSATVARSPVRRPRAVALAQRGADPTDVFVVETRVSPEGHLIELTDVFNVSDTSVATERGLIVNGDRAAWLIGAENAITSVQYADLRSEPRPVGRNWTGLSRLQNSLTNLQETGQMQGFGRRAFKLDSPAYKVVLGFSSNALLIDADSHRIRMQTDPALPVDPNPWLKEQTAPKARPGNLVTWAVDRVRALPWFGDDRMQWLKAVAFDGVDHFNQIMGTVTGDDGSEAVQEELGDLFTTPSSEATDPETGWPPAPMEPMLSPPLKGEGKWSSTDKDPFILKNPGASSPFVYSFIRSDRARIYSQVFVTLWDPRQVELHAMSGTVEPKSATGETGPGMVPRTPAVMGRMLAGFNGGFQAIHGEFGMMAEKVLYLPPKPFAATVAELSDGSTAFGTWPEEAPVPDNIVSFRQNMTALLQDGVINPYKRHWWGGVPPGWTEEARTVRSALCMTKEGFIGYFYGSSVDPDVLALAMQRARCNYGIHLDMNPGHTGLEYYHAALTGTLPKLNRALDDVSEARGPVPGMAGWEFMGRRMIRLMALMNFPRYINTEQRDFFYLTLRHILPGDPLKPTLTPAESAEGVWSVQGLPQYGWPYAIAKTTLRPDATRPDTHVGIMRLDPKFLRVVAAGEAASQRVLDITQPLGEGIGTVALYHDGARFLIASTAPPRSTLVTRGFAAAETISNSATSAMGIDAAGMLVFVRFTAGARPGGEGPLLNELLKRLGCSSSLFFLRPLGVVLGDTRDSHEGGDASSAPASQGVGLARAEGPGARRLFPDTPVVPPTVWALLQQKRVRYR